MRTASPSGDQELYLTAWNRSEGQTTLHHYNLTNWKTVSEIIVISLIFGHPFFCIDESSPLSHTMRSGSSSLRMAPTPPVTKPFSSVRTFFPMVSRSYPLSRQRTCREIRNNPFFVEFRRWRSHPSKTKRVGFDNSRMMRPISA